MGELWRWNGHRARSGSRAPEHDHAWQERARVLIDSPEDLREKLAHATALCSRILVVRQPTVIPGFDVCLTGSRTSTSFS